MSPSRNGFALTEVLVALFVLGVSTVAVTGLAVLSTRTSFDAERQTVALAIANEEVEHVRSLPYEDVGYEDARDLEPDGMLDRRHDVQRNQQKYTVDTRIELVDDPVNGILPEISLNEETADYKRVTIQVGWQSTSSSSRNVSVVSLVSQGPGTTTCTPGDPEGCPGTESPGEGACVLREPCPESGVCPAPKPAPYCPPGAQYCQQCYSDKDCEAGNVCNTDTRACEPQEGACRTSDDCSGGQVCSNGQCEAKCTATSCGEGNICNQDTGICTQSCTGNSCSCPPGLQCNVDTELCEEKQPECSDGIDNNDPEDALADAADPGCHEDDNPDKPFKPDDPDETDGGKVVPTSTPPPPEGPCTSDGQCPSGMSCIGGSCQGDWCQVPNLPSLDCSLLPLWDPDPTCRLTISCAGRGRFVIAGYTPKLQGGSDPVCSVGGVIQCVPDIKWAPCPPCPDHPAQCEDGLNNDYPEDTDIDFPADKGCISRKDSSEKDIPPECSDGKDNDGDGTIDWNGKTTLTKTFAKDPDCFGKDDPSEKPMPECSDGGDNTDPDLVADDKDPACYIGNSVQPGNYRPDLPTENDPECSDTINNDFPEDLLIDAADPGCHMNNDVKNGLYLPGVDESDIVKPQCSDGKNNDSPEDVLTDAADPGCHPNNDLSKPYDKNDDTETNPVMQCADGYDNNGGFSGSDALGRIDKADPGCYAPSYDVQNGQYDQFGAEGSTECTDGSNNDAPEDYDVDAADPGCHVNDIATNAYVPADNFESQFPLNSCQQFANTATAQFVKQPDGSYKCPAGAICNLTTTVAGNSFSVLCEGGSAGILINRACSLYGFMGKPGQEGDENGVRACRENIILKFDKNRNRVDDGENWPPMTVQCAPNETACKDKNSCSASFGQARCGGPPNNLPQPFCSPFTGSLAISCRGCIGKSGRDGICATCAGEDGSNDTTCKSQPGERCMQDSNCSGGLKCTLDRGSPDDVNNGIYRCQIPCSADSQCPAGKTCSVHDFNPFGKGACIPK